tara:strand:+ start:413 stop:1216 length:804 start_codon:yes stop_codon:yes gene_type:complete
MGLFNKNKKEVSAKLPDLPRFEESAVGKPVGVMSVEEKPPIVVGAVSRKPDLRGDVSVGKIEREKIMEVPSYESTFGGEKEVKYVEAVPPQKGLASESLVVKNVVEDIPVREPSFMRPKQVYTERINSESLDRIVPPKIESIRKVPSSVKTVNVGAVVDENAVSPSISLEQRGARDDVVRKSVMRKKFEKISGNVIKERPVYVQLDNYKDAIKGIEILKQKIREIEYGLDRLNDIKSQEQVEISNCETSLNKIKEKLIGIDKKLFEV